MGGGGVHQSPLYYIRGSVLVLYYRCIVSRAAARQRQIPSLLSDDHSFNAVHDDSVQTSTHEAHLSRSSRPHVSSAVLIPISTPFMPRTLDHLDSCSISRLVMRPIMKP